MNKDLYDDKKYQRKLDDFLLGAGSSYPPIPKEHRKQVRMLIDWGIKDVINHKDAQKLYYARIEKSNRITTLKRPPQRIEKVKIWVDGKPIDITCIQVVRTINKTLTDMHSRGKLKPYRSKSVITYLKPLALHLINNGVYSKKETKAFLHSILVECGVSEKLSINNISEKLPFLKY